MNQELYQVRLDHPEHVYFIGIGGISMSGIALILKDRGFAVTGSDRNPSDTTRELEDAGINVLYGGQKREHITESADPIDLVVYTAAIHPDNPEYAAAVELGIPMLTRAQMLGQVMQDYELPVAISGTHGKTTTTSMISRILLQADADPTLSIGGMFHDIHGNTRIGGRKYFVFEACEYTNSFLSFFPKIAIILDIDADHLDFFKDLDDIRSSFHKFAQRLPKDGTLIVNGDIPNLPEITAGLSCNIVTFGTEPTNDYWPSDITYDEMARPTYTLHHGSKELSVTLGVPGLHNVYNSMSAMAAADLLELDPAASAKALEGFGGTERRFEYKGVVDGVTIMDDYAHHPTEIRATLTTAQKCPHKTLWVVFQPHTYTRTKALMGDFAQALALADKVVLADIYAARETDHLGISSRTLQEEIRKLGKECYYFPSFDEIEKFLLQNCTRDDVLITMGAGNVVTIGNDLLGA